MKKYGFDNTAWEKAKEEGKKILIDYAKRRQMVPYSIFITHIHSIALPDPHDPRLAHFLDEISEAESKAGRGMLTALVVHKHGDYQPGPGFFELARRLGHDTEDIEKFWIQEVKRVFAAWAE